VHGQFRGRQGEDEPAAADVEGGKAQYVAQERAIGLSVAAENNYVGAKDHQVALSRDVRALRGKLPLVGGADARSARRRRHHPPTRLGATKYE
jgi:hypothetical protein